MSEQDNNGDLFGKPVERTEEFIDELDSLKEILNSDFESDLPETEDELEKAIADALDNIRNFEEIPVVTSEEPKPVIEKVMTADEITASIDRLNAEEADKEAEQAVEIESLKRQKTLETAPVEKVAVATPPVDSHEEEPPVEDENIPPLLEEVVFSGDQLLENHEEPVEPEEHEKHQEPITLTDNISEPSGPAMESGELKILVETLIDREIPRIREELREILMQEIGRLFPDIK